jgi:hypothetical protein
MLEVRCIVVLDQILKDYTLGYLSQSLSVAGHLRRTTRPLMAYHPSWIFTSPDCSTIE